MRLPIVEDDPKVADIVARGLRAGRFAVDVAGDGLAARQMLDTYGYDLLILIHTIRGVGYCVRV